MSGTKATLTVGQEYRPHGMFVGIFVPLGLIRSGLLSPGALLLFGRLMMYHGRNSQSWPKIDTLAADLAVSDRTVDRWMEELVERGFIRRAKRGQGKSAECVFLWHSSLLSSLRGGVKTTDLADQTGIDETTDLASETGKQEFETTDLSCLETTGMSRLDTTNLSSPYKEEETHRRDSMKETHPPPPQGSSQLPAEDEEEFPFSQTESQNQPQPQNPRTEAVVRSEQDIEALQGFLQAFMAKTRGLMATGREGEVSLPSKNTIEQICAKAPGWTVAQIAQALTENTTEHRCKPESYAWFGPVVADIYRRRSGIPPELPKPSPEPEPCSDHEHPHVRANNGIPQPPTEPEYRCVHCRDCGEFPKGEICHYGCEAGKKRARQRTYERQSDRWQAIYNKHRNAGLGGGLDFSPAGTAFLLGTPDTIDERENILRQLESGVQFDQVLIANTSDNAEVTQ